MAVTETGRVMDLIHTCDPYVGFQARGLTEDMHGWGFDPTIFRSAMGLVPNLSTIIEVGTWKGSSAIGMGLIAREMRIDVEIVCVDTWLGATEFWIDRNDEHRYVSLNLRNGFPTVYYQFLYNVVHEGLCGVITPFPQTSLNAARILRHHDVRAEFVYIDGSHETPDVYADIVAYWSILRNGGVMFGDDYQPCWSGVVHDVDRFTKERSLALTKIPPKFWLLRKPT